MASPKSQDHTEMDAFVSIEKTLKEAEPHTTNHLVHRIVEQTVCSICQDHMFVPFMTHCGHNFCYECISSWLQEHESCPACRSNVDKAPALNIALQNLALTLYTTTITVVGHTPPELERERQRKIQYYKKDQMKQNLFNGIFKEQSSALVDEADGVQRCGNCHWEIEGDICPNCNTRVRGYNPDFPAYADDDVLESDIEDYRYAGQVINGQVRVPYDNDALEEEDSDDGFLDDTPLEELELVSEDDGLSSGSSSPVRQPRRAYVPSFLSTTAWEDTNEDDLDVDSDGMGTGESMSDASSWHGFANADTPHRFLQESDDDDEHDAMVRAVFDRIDYTDSDEDHEYGQDEEEGDDDDIHVSPSRPGSRGIPTIIDSEED